MAQDDEVERRSRLLRFWACASGFWKGKSAKASWPLTAALIAVALAQIAVQYLSLIHI